MIGLRIMVLWSIGFITNRHRIPPQQISLCPLLFGPDQSHYNQSTNYTDRPQVNIHCIENFFTVRDFWATSACPEKTELPWIFSMSWIYFLRLGFLSNFAFALKNRGCREFTVLNIYFLHSGFLSNLRLPWKTELSLNFSLYWNIFLSLRVFEQLALALKTEFALQIFKPGARRALPDPPPRTPMHLTWMNHSHDPCLR